MEATKAIWAPDILPGMSRLTNNFQTYTDFRKGLKTNYFRVQINVLFSFLILPIYLFIITRHDFNIYFAIPILFVLSLTEHRLLNVIHEGAHWLIAKKRFTNDLFTNAIAGIFFVVDVDQYRQTHIQHHRNLGKELDPENSHMEKLDATWLISAFTGIGSIRKVIQRKKSRNIFSVESRYRHFIIPMLGILLHSIIILALITNATRISLWVWIIATYLLAPGLGLLRNLLEHRYVEAIDTSVWDFLLQNSQKDGLSKATTRTFTRSKLSQLYGSMGFTRHLIHHWDPSISYLNLKKVHGFLLQTQIGPALEKTNSTFTSTFIQLWRK